MSSDDSQVLIEQTQKKIQYMLDNDIDMISLLDEFSDKLENEKAIYQSPGYMCGFNMYPLKTDLLDYSFYSVINGNILTLNFSYMQDEYVIKDFEHPVIKQMIELNNKYLQQLEQNKENKENKENYEKSCLEYFMLNPYTQFITKDINI